VKPTAAELFIIATAKTVALPPPLREPHQG
jgi:hypothetical protein